MSFTTTHHTASRLRLLANLIGVAAWIVAIAMTAATVLFFVGLRTGAAMGAPVVTTGVVGLVVTATLVSWIWAYHSRGILFRFYVYVFDSSTEDTDDRFSTRVR